MAYNEFNGNGDGSGGGGASYDDTAIKARLDNAEEWVDTLKMKTYSVAIDRVAVPPAVDGIGGRINVQAVITNLPDGWEVKALRSYSVSKSSGTPADNVSWKQVSFNMIGTTGGGLKTNLGILNNSNEPALVKVVIDYCCGKIYPQS